MHQLSLCQFVHPSPISYPDSWTEFWEIRDNGSVMDDSLRLGVKPLNKYVCMTQCMYAIVIAM